MRLLTLFLYVPGRKVLQQLLPLALGGGASVWSVQHKCIARADSTAAAAITDSKGAAVSQHAAAQPAQSSQPGNSVPKLMAKFLGGNEFANVSCLRSKTSAMHKLCQPTIMMDPLHVCACTGWVNTDVGGCSSCWGTCCAELSYEVRQFAHWL